MSHQRHVSSFSAASRSSVFVQPDSKSGQLKVTPDAAILHLTYPYPLPLTALLDLIYTFRNNVLHETPRYLIMLTTLRLVVLGGFVGLSPRWRSRGGWVALVCGSTVGVAVWEGCAGQLKRHRDRSGDANPNLSISTTFLVVTASIAVFEYLLFLLLLRLSPPPQRNQPFSLRPPPSTAQSPPAIPPSGSSAYHPASPSAGRHYRRASQRTVLSLNTAGPASYRDHHILDLDLDEEAGEPDDPEEDFTSDSASSISASSIIDLPPALSPSRIIPPTSLSLDRGLNLAALDGSPVIGPLVRRTRSAKSLGRRILSGMSGQVERGEEEGYGTFEASS